MLPGDELVADYLARAGRAAAAALPPADCATVVEEVGRRVRAQVGAPPRWDLHGTEQRLADLGDAEDLVTAVGRELFPDAFAEPDPEPEAEPEPEVATQPELTLPPIPPTEAPSDNPTLDLGTLPRPVLPAQAEARVSEPAGAGPSRGPFRPLFRDEAPPQEQLTEPPPQQPTEPPPAARPASAESVRVRPIGPNESLRDGASTLNRFGWEIVALAILGLAVFPFGYLGWALGAVLTSRSRYWEISDKVRVLIGMPTAALGFAVLWAWLQATQIQESNDSSTRLSEAGDSLAGAFEVMPQLCGVLGAIYLGYALARDHSVR
jgi:hypothetical protein